MRSITREVVKPRDCCIATAIPQDRDAFERDQAFRSTSYASEYFSWVHYDAYVINPFKKLMDLARKLQVDVVPTLSCAGVRNLFNHEPRYKVIIIVSHYDRVRRTVELSDADLDIIDFADRIPKDFLGFLDAPFCYIEDLALFIRQQRPACRFRYRHGANDPDIWFAFYRVLLMYLDKKETTYLEAIEAVVAQLTRAC